MRCTILLATLMLCGCDAGDAVEKKVTHGNQAADEARRIVAGDADQRIAQAAQLVELGKLTDAENLLNQLPEESLSAESRTKLRSVRERLAAAKP